MRQSEQIDQLVAALAEAQAQFTNPDKTNKAKIETDSGTSYYFMYAPMAAIVSAVRAHLGAFGLSFVQEVEERAGTVVVERRGQEEGLAVQEIGARTTLYHKTGQFLSFDPLWMPVRTKGQPAHQRAAALSASKRHGLATALGVVADDDRDADAEKGESKSRGAAPPKPETAAAVAYITPGERTRLAEIAKASKVTPAAIKTYLKAQGIESSEKIPADKYQAICRWVQGGVVEEPGAATPTA